LSACLHAESLEDECISNIPFGLVSIDVWSLEINASAYQGLYNLLIYVGDGKHKGNCIGCHD
jgi:hypothetical protein